ncbi:hypothetical protein HF521_005543 [Silurus meridionalis]|uniref:Uncharacterized protein n=1 Tax=Silurus meridionalis TaxID=175797 RepID=A0A8T0AXK3_SILME|nr:hypothetical protein HF521_005543 [Silurus meridionalis]
MKRCIICGWMDIQEASKVLDDISSKTGIALKSCHHQYLVLKVVEQLKGPLVENMQHHSLLSNSLARLAIKKLQYLSFQDLAFCTDQLISYWTVGAFLHDLKELKFLVNDKYMLYLVCSQLEGKIKIFTEMKASSLNPVDLLNGPSESSGFSSLTTPALPIHLMHSGIK